MNSQSRIKKVNHLKVDLKNIKPALAGVAQWTECWPANRSQQFDSQPGHMPELQARSPVGGVGEATDQCISHTSLFFSLFFSLHSPLTKNK